MASTLSSDLRGPPFDARTTPSPPVRFLSNGSYRALVTSSGASYSELDGLAITPWSGDRTTYTDGPLVYVRDRETGRLWTTCRRVDGDAGTYETRWRPGRIESVRVHDGIEVRVETCVASDDPVEIRRVLVINRSKRARCLDLTFCAEVVLNDPVAHRAHPAFSKLFLQTEMVADQRAVLVRRRPRGLHERTPWVAFTVTGRAPFEHETDRARFFGRGGSVDSPAALTGSDSLSGTTGNVLDPVASLQCRLELPGGGRARTAFVISVAPDRQATLALANRFLAEDALDEAVRRAETLDHRRMDDLEIGPLEAEYFQALGGAVLFGDPRCRASADVLERARGDAASLERHGIDSSAPLVVLCADTAEPPAVRAVQRAQRYWHALGLRMQLVVLGNGAGSEAARVLAAEAAGACLLSGSDLPESERDLLLAVARLVVTHALPDFEAQSPVPAADARTPHRTRNAAAPPTSAEPLRSFEPLRFFNGIGGFSEDGREYVLRIPPPGRSAAAALPPRPWINVIANPRFGLLVSETGAGTTWSGNSREHRLTPWSNDPLLDPHSEAFYIRDDETDEFWSPLPGPAPAAAGYEVRHGFGYTTCRCTAENLEQETRIYVPPDDPLRITSIRVTNHGVQSRRLSFYAYYRLVLGAQGESDRFVRIESCAGSATMFARNAMADGAADAVAFASAIEPDGTRSRHVTGDRTAFLGPEGRLAAPAALRADALDGRAGVALDPCIAQQIVVELSPGASARVSFVFGEADSRSAADALVRRYAAHDAADTAWDGACSFWQRGLTAVRVETPLPALDLLVNGWLAYQALSCRIWGRTAAYQSGGAFGFRDQLQDAAALVHHWPERTREQILLHAAHQFVQGDVLHWWHPPRSRGIRTRFADDLLWLPWATALYVRTTGDREILDEQLPFLTARALGAGEDEAYLVPRRSGESADVYEHCVRALDRSLVTGAHGLPLFGSGDWNDGMNRVGREGKGESVWMGMFLYHVLGRFIPLCEGRGDDDRARRYRAHRGELRAAVHDAGWDGKWYRRGYYDSGEPLGSARSDECRIDALAQAWAVISGIAPDDRAAAAMDEVESSLISDDDGLIRLLTPPFAETSQDPGYIRGYVAGVRENGGQYTHAALWVVRAMAQLGRRDRTAALLELLNPVHHAETPEQVRTYGVEPYVVAADVYGAAPHVGRGGWTWYTGAAGWMQRVAMESLLGFAIADGCTLVLSPGVPDDWPGFRLTYRVPHTGAIYDLHVTNPGRSAEGVVSAEVDGAPVVVEDGVLRVPLVEGDHRVDVVLGAVSGNDG